MPRKGQDRPGAISGYWLSRRPNSDQWCRTWFDRGARQTRRASLGTDDLEHARVLLAQWVTLNAAPRREHPQDVPLATVFARYYAKHGRHTVGAATLRRNLHVMLETFPVGVTVGELNLELQPAAVT